MTAQDQTVVADVPVILHEPFREYQAKSKLHLTSHQLADFRRCPLLYHKKKLGLVPDEDRPAYLIGRALHTLVLEGHEYGAVIIDSLDWLLRRAEEHVAGVDGTTLGMKQTLNRAHGGYGNGKLVLKNYVYQYLLPTLDKMVNAGIAVILLAHTTRREITTIEGITTEKSAPEIHPDLANTMIEWSDFVGAANMVGDTRQLVLCETNQLLAKNRYGIHDPLPLSWPALMDAMTSNLSLPSTT